MNKHELKERLPCFIQDLRFQEKSKRTVKKYECDIVKFIEFIKHDESITKQDTIDYKEFISEGDYKPSSINSFIIALNKYLRYCHLDDCTVKKLKIQQASSLEDVLSIAEYNKLLRRAKALGYQDIYLIMKILAGTGIRISELRFFTVENISKSFYIEVRNKGKDRTIVIPQELSRELKRYIREHKIKKGKLFTVNEVYIWRKMKLFASTSSVKKSKVHAHSFRHLFAKEYIKQFNNPLELADLLGHNNLETTRLYTRSTNHEKRMNLESMHLKERNRK